MLVLTRKSGDSVVIDGCIEVRVLQVRGNRVRLGIDAPDDVSVCRGELQQLTEGDADPQVVHC